ncbi:Peptide-N(4)-(N-acetyl-beta-glucosaminyl)asparagine amidase [Camellia lanceoleosa]|uniref:Peptide-N(4)-(N-acetyl-beta-glucosaminyl)asparagine amidase n=1 Tax=Camellia lanceoleosa TaxID=1840588 RepID=A0ACC0GUU1_9ERIC|nr:Peptide-N(4)-(N-acetyl-beta-glucosaminyl)asparagine amidase [Camellia lanceoleosa]
MCMRGIGGPVLGNIRLIWTTFVVPLDDISALTLVFALALTLGIQIYSGLVLASGEELSFGIVTSAFDGTRMSKWEEPNGARGEGCLSHQEGT